MAHKENVPPITTDLVDELLAVGAHLLGSAQGHQRGMDVAGDAEVVSQLLLGGEDVGGSVQLEDGRPPGQLLEVANVLVPAGIEMEADKPNWYDSLNGLPGLLGSSVSETLELKRYCMFLINSFAILELSMRMMLSWAVP